MRNYASGRQSDLCAKEKVIPRWYKPLTVDYEDICEGKRDAPERCPLALALMREWNDQGPAVGSGQIDLHPQSGVYIDIPTIAPMEDFMEKFDRNHNAVFPQTFLYPLSMLPEELSQVKMN